jgi:hypothetical protein
MNTGQMLLTICALALFGTTVFTVNKNNLNNGTILRQTELGIYAVSLGTSFIQRASEMDFDENTVGGLLYITTPMLREPNIPATWLTAVGYLGIETNASGRNKTGPQEWAGKDTSFDDFDDYNNFQRDTLIADVDSFHVAASVFYVNQDGSAAATMTWQKEMDISVSSTVNRQVFTGDTGGIDIIKLSYILAFYK